MKEDLEICKNQQQSDLNHITIHNPSNPKNTNETEQWDTIE